MSRHLCLALAVISTSGLFAACEADDSLPTRPRTANFLTPDARAQENAEHKALEGPSKSTVPGGGSELPGQRSAGLSTPTGTVVTLDASSPSVTPAAATPTNPKFPISGFTGPSGWNSIGNTTGPTTTYTHEGYKHFLPALPANPGTVPMTGATPAPDAEWSIDHSWGQGLTLENYPHRPWAPTTAAYHSGLVAHNPVYYFNLEDHINLPPAAGPRTEDVRSALIETPWFFANTVALPVLMILEPPLSVRTTDRSSVDPVYRGAVPAAGPVVPAPVPGTLRWDYPFLNADGTVKPSKDLPRNTPAVQP